MQRTSTKWQSRKLDPVIGRDEEIRRVLQILTRTKKQPYACGRTRSGKTAIAEGLAHRIVDGDVPDNLKDKIVFSLIWALNWEPNTKENLKNVLNQW
jgi:ATP-dependent Clp protease ATP-binding subunit ClpB